jgi:SAM-dependent methyltransferase
MAAGPAAEFDSLRLRTPTGSVPLGYVEVAGSVYLVARARSAQWPVDLLRTGRAELEMAGRTARGTPELVVDPEERARILDRFRAKYGDAAFDRWYDRPARVVQVSLGVDSASRGPGSAAYYHWLESEFDNVADDYDRHITGNRINRLLRDRSLAVLTERFARAPRLLEIGCGSGMETLPLLRQGHEVTAVDISGRMLATVRRKAEEAGVSDRLTTHELAARDLDRLDLARGNGPFDGAYSTYGALNCEPDLTPIPGALARLLRPGAPFVTAVYNRWCLFELAGYSMSLQPRRALGRRRNPVPVGASRFCVDVYAYSVTDFERLLSPRFDLERLEAVPVLLPPSDLVGYAERFGRHFDRLAAWDARLGRRWPLNRMGDHFLMTWVRRP